MKKGDVRNQASRVKIWLGDPHGIFGLGMGAAALLTWTLDGWCIKYSTCSVNICDLFVVYFYQLLQQFPSNVKTLSLPWQLTP